MNYKIYCFIFILLIWCYKKKAVEGLFQKDYYSPSCCGGLSPNEFDKNTNSPPFKIHRCMKDYDYYKPCPQKGSRKIWSDINKDHVDGWIKDGKRNRWYREKPSCCNGIDTCIPTTSGGKCKLRSGRGYYIYNKKGQRKSFDPNNEIFEESEYKYQQQTSTDYLIYLNYFILLIISLFIIYYFQRIFVENEIITRNKYDYGYMGDNYMGEI
tara:strand:+ start:48 stop:680 length:633 start_codon:yes stop_codon:yes gene_type:complete